MTFLQTILDTEAAGEKERENAVKDAAKRIEKAEQTMAQKSADTHAELLQSREALLQKNEKALQEQSANIVSLGEKEAESLSEAASKHHEDAVKKVIEALV